MNGVVNLIATGSDRNPTICIAPIMIFSDDAISLDLVAISPAVANSDGNY
jgi:hypothetical protein